MKALIMTDIEGVAGVVSFEKQSYADGKYYEQAKHLLTQEVNAAVAGLGEAAVDEVLVIDGHGSGGIVFEELHPSAKLMHGRPLAPLSVREEVWSRYDVFLMVGQHAMAGKPRANMNHTMSSKAIEYYKLNGRRIGEIAIFALYQGALGTPFIFLSGDDQACEEAEELQPGVKTVAVKEGLGRTCAVSMPAEESRRRIREGVREAVARHEEDPLPPVEWEGPYELEKRYFHTDMADNAAQHPNGERVDEQTVRWRSDDVREVLYT